AAAASPTCVTLRPNGRCSLSGSVWPSVIPVFAFAGFRRSAQRQQAKLLGTTPFRRQERDFLPRRPRSEFGRLPFQRLRYPNDALEKPAVGGHFRRVSTCQQKT